MHSTFINKKICRTLLASAVAVGMLGVSNSVIASNSAEATATARVIAPIAIKKEVDLNFGTFYPSEGTITVSTSGFRSSNGVIVAENNSLDTPTTAARFNVTGEPGALYNITLIAGDFITDGGGVNKSMNLTLISDLDASNTTSGQVANGTLTGGAQSIYVGGILTVDANQVTGDYSGTVTATVEYN